LTDYIDITKNNEYISIQAEDLSGNKSPTIQIKNPYYIPILNTADETASITVEIPKSEQPKTSESAIPNGKPFTPGGSGTVMDNATDGDGKEFFTVKTEDGSVFYLIVDRQRNTDNVYLLNAVSEEDLIALAEKNGKTIKPGNISAIPTAEQDTTNGQNLPSSEKPKPEKTASGGINMTYIIIGIAVIAAGGLGYYFKIVKGKKKVDDTNEDTEDDNYDDESEPEEPDDDLNDDETEDDDI